MRETGSDSMLETAGRPDDDDDDNGDDGENGDENGDENGEEAQAHAAPVGPTPEELEARRKKAEKATLAYAKRIADIYEEEAKDLVPCALCPDVHKGFLNVNDAGRVPADIAQVVKLFLGIGTEVRYKPSQYHTVCTQCDGEGRNDTGSHVHDWESIVCRGCKGFGFVPPPSTSSNGDDQDAAAGALAGPSAAAGPLEDVDPSGEPRLLPDGRQNPNFGKWPQFKVSVPPWGVTAGLTALDATTAS